MPSTQQNIKKENCIIELKFDVLCQIEISRIYRSKKTSQNCPTKFLFNWPKGENKKLNSQKLTKEVTLSDEGNIKIDIAAKRKKKGCKLRAAVNGIQVQKLAVAVDTTEADCLHQTGEAQA